MHFISLMIKTTTRDIQKLSTKLVSLSNLDIRFGNVSPTIPKRQSLAKFLFYSSVNCHRMWTFESATCNQLVFYVIGQLISNFVTTTTNSFVMSYKLRMYIYHHPYQICVSIDQTLDDRQFNSYLCVNYPGFDRSTGPV